jgi:adenylate cyclase
MKLTLYLTAGAVLALIGLLQFEVLRRWPSLTWAKYVFVALDCIYLSVFLVLRHPLSADLPPVTLAVKEGALLFYIAFLVQSAFSYSPRFILWTGGWILASWAGVVLAAAMLPQTTFSLPDGGASWAAYGNPDYLPLIKLVYDFVIFCCILAGLVVAVWRSRELVKAAAISEKARANLARHFSPKVLDELSTREQPFGAAPTDGAAAAQKASCAALPARGRPNSCRASGPVPPRASPRGRAAIQA